MIKKPFTRAVFTCELYGEKVDFERKRELVEIGIQSPNGGAVAYVNLDDLIDALSNLQLSNEPV